MTTEEQFTECTVVSTKFLIPPINVELKIINKTGRSEVDVGVFNDYIDGWIKFNRVIIYDHRRVWVQYMMAKYKLSRLEYFDDVVEWKVKFRYDFI